MPRQVGKVYKSAIMINILKNYEKNVLEIPGFKDSKRAPHLLPTKPFSPTKTSYPARPTFGAVYSSDPASFGLHSSPSASSSSSSTLAWSSPPTDLRPTQPHPTTLPPLTYLEFLLENRLPESKGLTQELALQMVTHVSHPAAQRGTAPHNLKMAFLGRRVLEMHLQMFLLHADAQRAASSKPAIIDTSNAPEEQAGTVRVIGAEEEAPSEVTAEAESEVDLAESVTGRSLKNRKAAVERQANIDRWTVTRGQSKGLGDGTPGKVMDLALSELSLGESLGEKWNVAGVMLYDAGNHNLGRAALATYRGSVIQSIFGGLSHAYGAAFTSRLFLSQALPALRPRLPEWTWNYVEEQRLKVEQEGGIWGKQ